jgi:hypothetical protein
MEPAKGKKRLWVRSSSRAGVGGGQAMEMVSRCLGTTSAPPQGH